MSFTRSRTVASKGVTGGVGKADILEVIDAKRGDKYV